jgi:hypothetical protein
VLLFNIIFLGVLKSIIFSNIAAKPGAKYVISPIQAHRAVVLLSAMLPNLSISGFFEIDNPYCTLSRLKPLSWISLFVFSIPHFSEF